MATLFNYFSLFNSKREKEIELTAQRDDIYKMKEAESLPKNKLDEYLCINNGSGNKAVLREFKRVFAKRFKKFGNLNQKCPYCDAYFNSARLGEKICSSCEHTFIVQKRVQDMNTIAFKLEEQTLFEDQWKAVNNIKKFKEYLSSEFEYIKKQLAKNSKIQLETRKIEESLIDLYVKKAISSGYYQLYATFIFYKAELMRENHDFVEALNYYFYLYFLHNNGVTNSASFDTPAPINAELANRIMILLNLARLKPKEIKPIFNYAVSTLNIFNKKYMNTSPEKSYLSLLKELKHFDAKASNNRDKTSYIKAS